jgi:predicted ribosome quality control (RQC) complex YloA/Tae2 family protein
VCTLPDGSRQVSALPLTHATDASIAYDEAQDAVAAVYEPVMQTTVVESTRRDLHKRLRQRQKKLQKKIRHLQADQQKLETYLDYHRYGTLLVGHQAPRGTSQTQVVDYYSPEQAMITIALDPRLSMHDNAQAYFKKFRKARNGLDTVRDHLQQCTEEAHYLDGLEQQIVQAEEASTLQLIRAELGEPRQESPRQHRTQVHLKSGAAVPYRTFKAHDGTAIYCGKSNQGNDWLLQQTAQPDDLWFHAHQHAGAHVLLKVSPQHDVPPQTLMQAAALAAFYSQGKEARSVEVMYTQARHVRKFRGARPGQVQVTTYRLLEVAPQLPEAK